jgi:hypothetical protein
MKLSALRGAPEDPEFDAATRTAVARLRAEWALQRRHEFARAAKPLFDEDPHLIEAVQSLGPLGRSSGSWKVWRPSDPAWPVPVGYANLSCVHGELRVSRKRADALSQPMCLAEHDVVSEGIRRFSRWRDCSRLVRIWQAVAADAGTARGVALDIGANVGACTVELLLRTTAHVVAIEP